MHQRSHATTKAVCAAASAFFVTSVAALPIAFNDPGDFLAALPPSVTASVLDFEGVAAGNASTVGLLIPDGGTLGGITFDYPALAGFGISLEVRDDFNALSGENYLGTDDGGVLQNVDDLAFTFGASHAVGLFILTADLLLDDDVLLTAAGLTVGIEIAQAQVPLPDGSFVHFLGIVDPDSTFTEAALTAFRGSPECAAGCFTYNIDDISTTAQGQTQPVPAPSSLTLLALGLAAVRLTLRSRSANNQKRK
jgi:hypothetical protein